jgi:hypothetical protein
MLQSRAHLPANDDLHDPIAVHVDVPDALERRADALNDLGDGIVAIHQLKNIDFQRTVAQDRKKGYDLIYAIPVQVLQLHRLPVRPARRRRKLRAKVKYFIDDPLEPQVLLRSAWEAVQFIRSNAQASGEEKGGHDCQQGNLKFFRDRQQASILLDLVGATGNYCTINLQFPLV